jgi:NAD(P)-dependent dehydrogenase (short-subunit alcohol dehydrogenase family)
VDEAEKYLQQHDAWKLSSSHQSQPFDLFNISQLRRDISEVAGFPLITQCHQSDEVLSFCQREDLEQISQQGPATPDHVIRTKRLPMLNDRLIEYVADYQQYFESHALQARNPVEMLDPAPRVVLDPALGMLSIGKNQRDAAIVADIYRHTIGIIQRAERLGGWRALPAKEIFEVEYWELEQAKLRKGGSAPSLQGEIALVTGAASGIGKACVESLLARGAAVVGLDLDADIAYQHSGQAFLGLGCDITDAAALTDALTQTVLRFGGLDMLILNAGVFPGGCPVAALDDETWRRVMDVNLDANLRLLRLCHPYLKLAPKKGRVGVIGSKNIAAPGQGAAAYSASKAALNQLARVTALEWAGDGIRINSLHPDAVFDTGIWTDEVLAARAEHYGLSVEAYKKRNLLKTEITSRDVAELAAELCDRRFSKTTGAHIPVDGGNDRVI